MSDEVIWAGHGFAEVSQKILKDEGVQLSLWKHGDKASGLFIGEPFAWEESAPEPGRRDSLKIAMNFYALDMNAMRVVVLCPREFRELCRLRDRYDLHRWVFTLIRDGVEGNEDSRLWFQVDHEFEVGRRRSDADWATACHDLAALFGGRQRHHGLGAVAPTSSGW